MKRLISCFLGVALLVVAGRAESQTPPTPADTLAAPAATPAPVTPPPPPPPAPTPAPAKASRIYYGGAVGFSFWSDYWRISVEPLVGFKLTPKLSAGVKFRYEYLNDSRGAVDYDANNYGGSVFSRYRLIPPIYAHAEFAYMSYDYPGERQEVPFLLLGGGYSKPLGPNTWLNVEVLFDVLQDGNSPYEDWEPLVSVGVGVGF